MEKTGSSKLFNDLVNYTNAIDLGRKNFHLEGKEAAGRVLFSSGIEKALNAFKEIQNTNNPQIIISAERIYIQQDIQFCDPADKLTIRFLNRSLTYLGDALRSIEVVKSAQAYRNAEATHATEHREKRGNVPKDVVHNACNINSNRLDQNNRIPGLTMDEKALIKQRKVNLEIAKLSYIEMQKQALGLSSKTQDKP